MTTADRAVVDSGRLLVAVVLGVGSVTVVEGSDGDDVVLLPAEVHAAATTITTASHVTLTLSSLPRRCR